MNCEWLRNASAFNCVPVQGLHGEAGIEIGTPFSYADGTAIVLYALDHGDHTLLSDNGDMLAHLSAAGINTNSGHVLRVLRERVASFGLMLTERCDVRAVFPADQAGHRLAQAISAMLAVAEWEREHGGVDRAISDLAAEAEMYLRQWRGDLHPHPVIAGQSGKGHSFAFRQGNELIDVITPNHTATGAAMRKAGDVLNSPHAAGLSIRVVIDDRAHPERAEVERQILGSLVKAMTLTKLRSLAPPGSQTIN